MMDEFSIIEKFFRPLSAGYPGAMALQDDAAIIPGPDGSDWVITKDAIVSGVHFFPSDPPELIARKLVRVNMSDLAAKGAVPEVILMVICMPNDLTTDWLKNFAAGMKKDCDLYGIALIGGDTVATPGNLTLTLTAIGKVRHGTAILRSNARIGDDVWVSGTIGDAFLGLEIARGCHIPALGKEENDWLLDRYHLPQPRLSLGMGIIGIANSAMDISDGLIGDLEHLVGASKVSATIYAKKLPISGVARKVMALRQDIEDVHLMTGGDDYELLFTAPRSMKNSVIDVAKSIGQNVTVIGEISDGDGVAVIGHCGEHLFFAKSGYNHF